MDERRWRRLEEAAASADAAKPRGPSVDPRLAGQQRAALALLTKRRPHLACEGERFRFDAQYFA